MKSFLLRMVTIDIGDIFAVVIATSITVGFFSLMKMDYSPIALFIGAFIGTRFCRVKAKKEQE